MKPRGSARCGASRSRPATFAVSIQGTTREMSSKSMSPRVRSVWKVCCSQVAPHLPNGVMTMSVGRGRYDLMPSGTACMPMRPWISRISARLRARCGAMASIR